VCWSYGFMPNWTRRVYTYAAGGLHNRSGGEPRWSLSKNAGAARSGNRSRARGSKALAGGLDQAAFPRPAAVFRDRASWRLV
jgi:hypothetical protein